MIDSRPRSRTLGPMGVEVATARAPRVARAGLFVLASALVAFAGASAQPGEAESAAVASAGDAALTPRVAGLLEDAAASLREAYRASDAGETELALALLEGLSRRHPVIADHADRLRAEILLEQGSAAEGAAVAIQSLTRLPDSPLRSELHQLLGDARSVLGDAPGARAAWNEAIAETRSDDRKSVLHLQVGESLERSGQLRAAAATYQLLWASFPTSDAADQAEKHLMALEAQLGSKRTGADWRKRADRLFRRRHNAEALAAYDRALELGLSSSAARRARYQRAHTLFRMRRYPEALEAFAALPPSDDTALWHARSLARAGDVMRSVSEFEDLARRARTGAMRMRATFLAGLLLDGRGFEERANVHFQRVAASSASSLSSAALWRLGWAAYRGKRFEEAVDLLERLMQQQGDPISALRGRYWRARALGQLGDERATAEFTAMAREFPFDYYGWRALARAVDDGAPPPPIEIDTGKEVLAPEQLERPRILLEAGLHDAAMAELRGLRRRARGLVDRVELAELLADSGDFNEAQRVMMDAYDGLLERGPLPRYEEIWWHAWPAAYFELVRSSTRSEESVEPGLVLAIMREESGYRKKVISPVGARGLMQIMVPTGERLAKDAGIADFEPDDLFDPATNIRLGAQYLTALSKRFDGRLSGAIASYNAGPDAVSSWGTPSAETDDEWVEAIPYDQTRSYVKRVLRSLRAYQVLY